MDMFDRPSVRPSRCYTTGFLPRPSCMTTLGVVHGNEVQVYNITTEAEIMIPVQAKPHLLEYMDLQMEALDEEHLRNDLDAY
jgi:hypothetical protein